MGFRELMKLLQKPTNGVAHSKYKIHLQRGRCTMIRHRTWPWVVLGFLLLLFSVLVARGNDNGGSLIERLGSKSFAVREKASKELALKMTVKLYQELHKLTTTDLEVEFRVKLALKRYEEKLIQEFIFLKLNPEETYPQYPWICFGTTYNHGCAYLEDARLMGAPQDNSPNWTDWRVATQLWIKNEITTAVGACLRESKSEKEFRCKMSCRIEAIKEDIRRMIRMEDRYWGGEERNPLRKSYKPDYY